MFCRILTSVLFASLLSSCNALQAEQPNQPEYQPVDTVLFSARDGLGNVFELLESGEPVNVAYLGGSITAANGWRVKTTARFRAEYPDAEISEIHAAIGGTGSDLGVFRLGRDVLQYDPDLLFVEFAVNDGGASPERIWRAMEGIVRQAWRSNPKMDICYVYTFRVGNEKELNEGYLPRSSSAMEIIADHYGIPSINLAMPIVEMANDGRLIYKSDEPTINGVIRFSSDGVHPLDAGHEIYTDTIFDAFEKIRPESKPSDHSAKLNEAFVVDHWEAANMTPITEAMLEGDWQLLPADDTLSQRFAKRMGPLWEGSKPGSKLTFRFRGSQAKLYDLVGPDGGQVVITIDGVVREKPIPRFDSYCTYHRISTLMLADNLDPNAVHEVIVEIHPEQPNRQSVAFRLENPESELKSPKFQGTKVRESQLMLIGGLVE